MKHCEWTWLVFQLGKMFVARNTEKVVQVCLKWIGSIVMEPVKHSCKQLICLWRKSFATGCFAKIIFGAFKKFWKLCGEQLPSCHPGSGPVVKQV